MKKRPRFGPFKNIWHLLQKYLKLASFSFIFVVSNNTIISANVCEKCPSSIRCCDLNPQPSEGESPPITSTKIGCFILYFCIACHLIRQTRKTQFVPVKQKKYFCPSGSLGEHDDLLSTAPVMELFGTQKEMKAVSAQVVSCCGIEKRGKISRTCMALFHSCQISFLSPSTRAPFPSPFRTF